MGLREEFLAKFARLTAAAEARQAAMSVGREAPVLSDEEVARGHPKVSVVSEPRGVTYGVRLGTWFGWFWLIFTCVHCVALFYGMSQGSVKMNGRMVAQPDWWHFALLALFYVPFFLVGFAFTVARYRLTLTDELVTVRWRVLPYLGLTSTLAAGDAVRVTLAFRGSKQNKRPVDSVVVASQGKEIHFGAFLPEDVKERLAGLIRHYYGDVSSREDFSATPDARPADVRPAAQPADHPRVVIAQAGEEVTLELRAFGGCFAWVCLVVGLLMLSLSLGVLIMGGELRVGGRLVPEPGLWLRAWLLPLPALVALAGAVMVVARRRVVLSRSSVCVGWRLAQAFTTTRRLEVRGVVEVSRAHRGARFKGRAVDSLVISSGGDEIVFGSSLDGDLQDYLVTVVARHYGVRPAGVGSSAREGGD